MPILMYFISMMLEITVGGCNSLYHLLQDCHFGHRCHRVQRDYPRRGFGDRHM